MAEKGVNEFNITFNGEVEHIDVRTLTSALNNMDTLVQEINVQLNTNKHIELNVRPFKEGSFDIFFALLADPQVQGQVMNMFSAENVAIIKNIIKTFTELLDLKKLLKGNEPKEVRNVEGDLYEIHNNEGDVKVVSGDSKDMYFKDVTINHTINQTFNIIRKEPKVEGMTVKDNEGTELFNVLKDEMAAMEAENVMLEKEVEEKRTKVMEKAFLRAFKPALERDVKWDFFYQGNRIPVKMGDRDFLKSVWNREVPFYSGDVFEVDMEITQKKVPIANAWLNESYHILKVHRKVPPEEQAKLDFDE